MPSKNDSNSLLFFINEIGVSAQEYLNGSLAALNKKDIALNTFRLNQVPSDSHFAQGLTEDSPEKVFVDKSCDILRLSIEQAFPTDSAKNASTSRYQHICYITSAYAYFKEKYAKSHQFNDEEWHGFTEMLETFVQSLIELSSNQPKTKYREISDDYLRYLKDRASLIDDNYFLVSPEEEDIDLSSHEFNREKQGQRESVLKGAHAEKVDPSHALKAYDLSSFKHVHTFSHLASKGVGTLGTIIKKYVLDLVSSSTESSYSLLEEKVTCHRREVCASKIITYAESQKNAELFKLALHAVNLNLEETLQNTTKLAEELKETRCENESLKADLVALKAEMADAKRGLAEVKEEAKQNSAAPSQRFSAAGALLGLGFLNPLNKPFITPDAFEKTQPDVQNESAIFELT